MHRAVEGGTDLKWVDLFSGVDAGRRLLRHHYRRESLNQVEENRIKMSVMMTLAVEATKRRESNCCRNGLLLMEEILRYARSFIADLCSFPINHLPGPDDLLNGMAIMHLLEALRCRSCAAAHRQT